MDVGTAFLRPASILSAAFPANAEIWTSLGFLDWMRAVHSAMNLGTSTVVVPLFALGGSTHLARSTAYCMNLGSETSSGFMQLRLEVGIVVEAAMGAEERLH